MENQAAQFMLSEKGRELLLFSGFKFSKANETKCGKIRWKCCNRRCIARIYTSVQNKSEVIEIKETHNHEPERNLSRQIISNAVKRKACEDISERPGKLINLEIRNNPRDDIVTQDINCIRRNMYIARRKTLPAMPKNRKEELNYLAKAEIKTERRKKCVIDVSEKEIVIFSCYANLSFLCHS